VSGVTPSASLKNGRSFSSSGTWFGAVAGHWRWCRPFAALEPPPCPQDFSNSAIVYGMERPTIFGHGRTSGSARTARYLAAARRTLVLVDLNEPPGGIEPAFFEDGRGGRRCLDGAGNWIENGSACSMSRRNAGGDGCPIAECHSSAAQVLAVNLDGVFLTLRAGLRLVQTGGAIVSRLRHRDSRPMQASGVRRSKAERFICEGCRPKRGARAASGSTQWLRAGRDAVWRSVPLHRPRERHGSGAQPLMRWQPWRRPWPVRAAAKSLPDRVPALGRLRAPSLARC